MFSQAILICSAARSGSTLLDMLLGGHSQSASLGEFSFLGKAISLDQTCSCGAPVKTCPSWLCIFERIERDSGISLLSNPYELDQWDARASVLVDRKRQTPVYEISAKVRSLYCDIREHLRTRLSLELALPRNLSEGMRNTMYLYEVISDEWKKPLVVDSSKNVHKAISLVRAFPQSVKILYLVRDGRGVFYSRLKSGFSPKEASSGWYNYNRRAMRLLQQEDYKDQVYFLKYEDLVNEPEKILRKVCGFLNIDFQSEMIDFGSNERHMVNGNVTMFKTARGLVPDTKWTKGLKSKDLEYFENRCGSLNRRLGYT